jgi:para-nitrobenzyl esterase
MHSVCRFVAGLVLAAFATAAATAKASAVDAPTLVQIDSGKVQGTVANGAIALKGIPFAQPPVGALRWRPPQLVASWKGVLEVSN